MTSTDRIEREVTLKAPVSRVWRAITDAEEFGAWFGVRFEGSFAEGAAMRGTFRRTFDEASMIAHQKSLGVVPSGIRMPSPHATFCTIERIEPERYFAYRWIPYGIDADVDPASEPTTLVEFRLTPTSAGGTRLTVVESGFDAVPEKRRVRAFRMNEGGWTAQVENVRKYVEES